MLARLQRQIEKTVDPHLIDLLAELHSYLAPEQRSKEADSLGIVVPLRLRTDCGTLAFLYTTLFGTPRDVTLDEIAIESFFPADPATAEMLRQLATGPSFAIINK